MNARIPSYLVDRVEEAQALLPHQQAQINAIRIAWMAQGAIAQRGSEHCESCDHCQVFSEARPYGEGSADETWSECSLGKNQGDKPADCPAYAARLADEAWQAQGEAEERGVTQ